MTFLEEQIAGLNDDAEKAAKDAIEALTAAQAEAASQLAALHTKHDTAVAELQLLLSAAQVGILTILFTTADWLHYPCNINQELMDSIMTGLVKTHELIEGGEKGPSKCSCKSSPRARGGQ